MGAQPGNRLDQVGGIVAREQIELLIQGEKAPARRRGRCDSPARASPAPPGISSSRVYSPRRHIRLPHCGQRVITSPRSLAISCSMAAHILETCSSTARSISRNVALGCFFRHSFKAYFIVSRSG